MQRFLSHILLISLGVILAISLLEGIVFRFILLPSDMPALEFRNGLIRYEPNQKGTYRVKNEISAAYRINAQGWNSTHPAYTPGTDKEPVIAVIGDSYVEALQVDVSEAFPEQLEGLLGSPYRVYRVGISGAPLSQYLEILRKEVIPLKPKVVIINLVHNDFDESYRFKPGFYTSSFLKIDVSRNALTEITPTEFAQPWYSAIRDLASWRYLVIRNGFRLSTIREIFLGDGNRVLPHADSPEHEIAISQTTREVTAYLIDEIASQAHLIGASLLLVIDGDRQLIYQGDSTARSESLSLNRMVRELAAARGISLMDLHPVFANEYATRHVSFNFESDFHWNAHGHAVVAHTILPMVASLLQAQATKQPPGVK